MWDLILFAFIKDRNSSGSESFLKKRDIKNAIEEGFPEQKECMDYFEDAFKMLTANKDGGIPYLKRIKGHSYALNEVLAENIIQDYRIASFFLKLVERFEEKNFSYKELKERFPNEPYLEVFSEELKKMGYISDNKVIKREDYYLIN